MWHHTAKSPSGNRVFNPQVLDLNRVYKTRDVSLQKNFKRLLTYDIVYPHYARLQISPLLLTLSKKEPREKGKTKRSSNLSSALSLFHK